MEKRTGITNHIFKDKADGLYKLKTYNKYRYPRTTVKVCDNQEELAKRFARTDCLYKPPVPLDISSVDARAGAGKFRLTNNDKVYEEAGFEYSYKDICMLCNCSLAAAQQRVYKKRQGFDIRVLKILMPQDRGYVKWSPCGNYRLNY